MSRLNLLARVMLGLMVFGGTLSWISIEIVDYANDVIETTILNELLDARYRSAVQGEVAAPLRTAGGAALVSVFSEAPGIRGAHAVPESLRGLGPGYHEDVVLADRLYYVLARDVGSTPVYVAYDITTIEATEERQELLLLAIAGGIVLLSCLAGYGLARTIIAPIDRLTRQVRALRPGEHGSRLHDGGRSDEIGVIAGAINGLLDRIDRFVEREQEFAATASHELRTPIAVISGSADVLAVVPGLPEASRRPIGRIVRAAHDMNEIVTALLVLAKERGADPVHEEEHTDVDEVIRHAIDDHRHLLARKEITVDAERLEPTVVAAPRGVVSIVVNNLVRNALQHTERGIVSFSLHGGAFALRNAGRIPAAGTPGPAAPQSRARAANPARKGLGLALIERICVRYGWTFTLESDEPGSAVVTVDFGEAVPKRESA